MRNAGSATARVRHWSAAALALAIVATAGACSKSGAGDSSAAQAGSGGPAKVTIKGDISFNDANLAKLDAALKTALASKDLSKLNQAMVVNVAVDYWNAGKIGFNKGLSDLKTKGVYQAPANGRLDQQLSILPTLRGRGIPGLSVSAIDPTAIKAPITSANKAGIPVLAIDSPLPKED